jgi:hypothetical protein
MVHQLIQKNNINNIIDSVGKIISDKFIIGRKSYDDKIIYN